MSKELLAIIRCINSIIQNSEAVHIELAGELCDSLKGEIGASSALLDKSGELMFDNGALTGKTIDGFKSVYETKQTQLGGLHSIIIPLKSAGVKTGTFVCCSHDGSFDDSQMIAVEYVSSLCTLILANARSKRASERTRSSELAKSAISTLSYSELEAIMIIFNELKSESESDELLCEGLIVASKIADKSGITRTVIVNAIRKLESAGVLESRSLGMKGTFIKVSNEFLLQHLSKL